MTPAELDAIEAMAKAATPGPWGDFGNCNLCDELHLGGCHAPSATTEDLAFCSRARADVPALVAEVRRLRELVKAAELNGCYPTEVRGNCPWCGYAPGNHKRSHAPECPAFTENREVR